MDTRRKVETGWEATYVFAFPRSFRAFNKGSRSPRAGVWDGVHRTRPLSTRRDDHVSFVSAICALKEKSGEQDVKGLATVLR